MSTVVKGYKSDIDTLLKGAPEKVIAKCTKFQSFDGVQDMTSKDRESFLAQVDELSQKGLRVLAIAEIIGGGELKGLNESNKREKLNDPEQFDKFEQGATFVGIVGIKDPARPEVKKAI